MMPDSNELPSSCTSTGSCAAVGGTWVACSSEVDVIFERIAIAPLLTKVPAHVVVYRGSFGSLRGHLSCYTLSFHLHEFLRGAAIR